MENHQLELQALYHKAVDCYRRPEPEQHDEGFGFLKEAAQRGLPEACKLLGVVYMSGQYDPWPSQDMKEALFWYQSAANAGDEEAMYWLGQCYQLGMGTEVNEEEAAYWIKQAKERGFVAEEEPPAEPEEEADGDLTEEAPEPEDKREPDQPTEAAVKERATVPESRPIQPHTVNQQTITAKPDLARYEEEEEKARKANQRYKQTTGLGGAACFLLAALAVALVAHWFLKDITHDSGSVVFWSLAGVWCAAAAVVGYSFGIKKAGKRIEEVVEYRKTPFYHAFGCELGQMNPQQIWCLKLYHALIKNYYPVTYRGSEKGLSLREYRGCLYPHWIYQYDHEKARPEFVVLTEKAVYVIHTQFYTGRIQGDLRDPEWSLFEDGEKDRTAVKIPNMTDANSRNMGILKGDLAEHCPQLPIEQIPFYNVVLLNPEVDIKGLRRVSADDDTFFVQGTPDKLRGNMALWESRMTTHNMNMDELMKAFEQIGGQFLRRSGW